MIAHADESDKHGQLDFLLTVKYVSFNLTNAISEFVKMRVNLVHHQASLPLLAAWAL